MWPLRCSGFERNQHVGHLKHGRRSREDGGTIPPRIWSGGIVPQILSCCKILSTRLLALQCRKMCFFCLYSRTFIVSPAMRPPIIPVRSTPMIWKHISRTPIRRASARASVSRDVRCLFRPTPQLSMALVPTHGGNDQARLICMAGYISGWFSLPQTVTHSSTNRAQRRATTRRQHVSPSLHHSRGVEA